MSLIENLSNGSLLSDETLLQASEGYRPAPTDAAVEASFAYWTERISVQPELASARELAGLSEEKLQALANEFLRSPRRKRTDRLRHAIPVGVALSGIGFLGFLMHVSFLPLNPEAGLSFYQFMGVAGLVCGLLSLAAGTLVAFSMVPLDMAHAKLGVYVGVLNEQHPWLYKTFRLMNSTAVEDYRQRVLRDRGPLRGIDYLMMGEIVRAHEALQTTLTAQTVAEQVQRPPRKPEAAVVVSVGPDAESAANSGERIDGRLAYAASVRAFGSAADRRRPN